VRKLKKTMAILSLLSPLGVDALGVGDIKLHSALNQNLRAEIPLVNPKVKSVSDIKVSLAAPDAFARAGIERPFYLSSLRFKPIIKTDGSIVVKVTSLDVIREPFVDFLLDVNWPQGHILREFTLLLDPPVTLQKKTIPAATPAVTQTQKVESAAVPKEETVIASPNVTTNPISFSSTAVPKPITPKTPKQFKSRSPKQNSRSYGFGEKYGPVVRNETLWNIVNSVKREKGVSAEQLLISMHQVNPHAFYKDNINALKAGQILTIPTRDIIVQRTREQASVEYKRQNDVWSGRINDVRAEKAKTNTPSKKSVESPDQLKLVSPSGEDLTEVGMSAKENASEKPNAKVDLALEMAASVGQENQQLQSRLAALEQQLVTMQRMLALKDEQLAALQSQNSQLSKSAALANKVVPEATIDLEKNKVQPKQVPKAKSIKKTVKPTLKKPKPTKTVSEEKPDGFLSGPFYLAASGAGIALLGLLAWVFIRKRRGESEGDTDSVLNLPEVGHDFASDKLAESGAVDRPVQESSETVESSFLSEFTPSEFDAIDTEHDEVDAISEADVYLAYGRYQQAEDLIQQAIKDEPNNDECKLKLLEIHFAKENREAFSAYASELKKDRRDDSAFWQKVVEMGRDLCPEDSLFSDGTETTARSETGPSKIVEVETAPSTGHSELIPESKLNVPQSDHENHLEFDVSHVGANNTSDVQMDGIDDSGTDWDDARQIELHNTDSNDGQDDEGSGQQSTNDDKVLAFTRSDANSEDVVGDLLLESGVEDQRKDSPASEVSELDFYLDDSNVDPEIREEEKALDEDFDGLTDMDEVETKLDLAKAYVDMEDGSAAQDILREIFEQGNEEQKSEAQDLMEKLQING